MLIAISIAISKGNQKGNQTYVRILIIQVVVITSFYVIVIALTKIERKIYLAHRK